MLIAGKVHLPISFKSSDKLNPSIEILESELLKISIQSG